MWKHRGSVFESGPGGRLGRRGLPYLLAFQVVLPLLAWWTLRGSGGMGQGDHALDAWLLLSGPLTALPLLLFLLARK